MTTLSTDILICGAGIAGIATAYSLAIKHNVTNVLLVDPQFPEYVLRGVAHMLPAMKIYFDNLPQSYVDGGYYVGMWENRPIIGPLGDVDGAYIIGALSGLGMQLSPAAGLPSC